MMQLKSAYLSFSRLRDCDSASIIKTGESAGIRWNQPVQCAMWISYWVIQFLIRWQILDFERTDELFDGR